jgi:SPP1 family phage portal protein
LIKQLVNYLLGNGIKWNTDQDTTDLLETLGKNFDRNMDAYATEAGKTAVAWIVPYIKNGQMKFKMLKAEEVVPVYEDEELIGIIRHYKYKGEEIIELWNDEYMTVYKGDSVEEKPYWTKRKTANGMTVEEQPISWGKVPAIPLWFNSEQEGQLYPIKGWIDIWDVTASDFANNIDDFQDVYWILKNYNGQDIDEFMSDLKQHKAMKVGEGGDATAETITIPTEARLAFLQLANDQIFRSAQGVDDAKLASGQITNVVAKMMYSQLDLKADDFQGQIEVFIDELMYFINVWHSMTGKTVYEDITPTFDRSMIVNDNENIEVLLKHGVQVSQKTLLENHPLVTDTEQEKERLEEEMYANPLALGVEVDED